MTQPRHHRQPRPHVLGLSRRRIDQRRNIQHPAADNLAHADGRRAERSASISAKYTASPGSGGAPAALRAHAIAFGLNGPHRRSISSARSARAPRCAAASLIYADTFGASPAPTADLMCVSTSSSTVIVIFVVVMHPVWRKYGGPCEP